MIFKAMVFICLGTDVLLQSPVSKTKGSLTAQERMVRKAAGGMKEMCDIDVPYSLSSW